MKFRFGSSKTSPYALVAALVVSSLAAVAGSKQLARRHAGPPAKDPARNTTLAKLAQAPLSFEANRGQAPGKVDFISRGPGYSLYVTPRGAAMVFAESARKAAAEHRAAKASGLAMALVGGSKTAHAAPVQPQAKRTNFLIGNDAKKWRRNVPNYGKVRYAGVYPGVDVVYYGNQSQLEYDFVVKPGADPKSIRLGFAGARDLRVDEKGDLVLKTSIGEVRQHRPVVYQNVGGVRKTVDAQYVTRGKREVGFQVAKYDVAQPLIIDPVISWSTYIGGTLDDTAMGITTDAQGNSYVCGYTESFDEARDNAPSAIDAAPRYPNKPGKFAFPTTGGAYITGISTATYQDDLDVQNGNDFTFTVTTYHTFVFKMNASGNGLIFSTYLGGALQNDYATALALDKSNNVYITGETTGSSFPRVRPLQAYNGAGDAFVVKLSADGSTPLFSSYVGGSGVDVGRAIAVDANGNAVVTGLTTSANLPVFNAVQPAPLSAARHQWVANINIGGNAFNYLTYLGGSNGSEGGDQLTENVNFTYSGFSPNATIAPTSTTPRQHIGRTFASIATLFTQDYASGVAVDALGNAYVTGATTSTNFPTTTNVYKGTHAANDQDIFLTKFSPFGQIVYSTYAGGTGDEAGRGIALDGNGNAYVTGYTNSSNLFTGVSGGFEPTFRGGAHDAFVLKFNQDASALTYATYLGGSGNDIANGIAVNANGYAYVTGYTTSFDLPILNPVQGNLNGGSQDAFLVKLVPAGNAVEYLTYIGGSGTEWGMGVAVDTTDAALITGTTTSGNYPVTLGAFQGGLRSTDLNDAGFIFDFPLSDPYVTRITNPPVAPSNLRITFVSTTEIDLAWDDNSVNETGFEIERSLDGVNFTLVGAVGTDTLTFQDKGLISNTRYFYRVRAVNSQGNSAYSNVVNITTLPSPPAAPSKITAGTLDQTRIQVQVTDGANNESNIILERSFDGTNFTVLQTFAAQAGTGTVINYIDGDPGTTPLTPNTKYYYRAKSTNTAGDSAYTSIVNATTLPAAPTVAPTGLTATPISSSEIDLSWTYPVSPTDAIGFKIYRGPDATNLSLYRVTTTPATTFADTGLPGTTTFFYKVAAYNASGDGPLSGVANAKTLPAPPADPNGLTATVGLGPVINLQWTDNSTTETDFLIERSTDGGATWPTRVFYVPPQPANQTGVRTYQDTTVAADTTYTYRVTADITVGTNHSLSKPTNTVTQATPPAAPAMVSLQGINSSTVLVVFTDNSKSETAFTVQRSVNGGPFTTVSSTVAAVTGSPNTVQFFDTNAQAEVTNAYKVFATNGAGSSATSSALSIVPLAAPSNVVFTATGQTTASISFKDHSGSESGFKAERSTDGNTWTAVSGNIPQSAGNSGTVTFTDSGLQANTQYTYRVWAFSANAESDRVTGQGTTLPNPPALPSNLTVAPGTQTTLNISFTDNSDNETGFVVERSNTANGTYTVIASPGASNGTGNVITLTDTGLTADTTYFYRVKAVNSGGDQGYVGPVSGTTPPNPPAAPTALSATLTAPTTITLTFTDNANNETGFVVQRSTDGGTTFPVTLAPVGPKVPSGTVTVVDSGLSTDASYTYQVKATNTGGDSSTVKSNTVMTAAAAPSNVTFTSISNNQIRMFWVNNSSTATSFKLERSTDGTNFTPLATVPLPNPVPANNQVSYVDDGLSGSTTYYYRVKASNGTAFDSDYSSVANATTLPNPAGAPSNLQLTAVSQTEIDLSFVDTSSNEDGFTVERSTDHNTWVPVGTNLPASTGVGRTVTVKDTGLKANTAYYYRVTAFNAGGGATAEVGPESTFPNPPASPNSLTVSVVPGSSTQLLLQWKDGSDNETGFTVERATGTSNVFTVVNSGIGASTGTGQTKTFTDNGLTPNTRYTYRVSATNKGGASQPSATASGLTLPGTPTGVTATANGANTGILIRWNAPTGGADSYIVEVKTDQPGDLGYRLAGTGSATDRSLNFVLLIPNVTFTFHVLAVNGSGSSAASNEASAKIGGGLVSLTVSPTSVKGRKSSKGTVTIVGSAPAGGATVSLSSSNGAVTVAPSVVIPAGSNSATFDLGTVKVKKATTATITASYGGTTKTATLKVKK